MPYSQEDCPCLLKALHISALIFIPYLGGSPAPKQLRGERSLRELAWKMLITQSQLSSPKPLLHSQLQVQLFPPETIPIRTRARNINMDTNTLLSNKKKISISLLVYFFICLFLCFVVFVFAMFLWFSVSPQIICSVLVIISFFFLFSISNSFLKPCLLMSKISFFCLVLFHTLFFVPSPYPPNHSLFLGYKYVEFSCTIISYIYLCFFPLSHSPSFTTPNPINAQFPIFTPFK
jgi:hypothetical protein